jgi:hypothetical protein
MKKLYSLLATAMFATITLLRLLFSMLVLMTWQERGETIMSGREISEPIH